MSALTMPARSAIAKPRGKPADEQRLLLHDVSWDSYFAIGQALPDRPAIRLTYDQGALEILTTSRRHEVYKKWLGRLFDTLAEEHGLAIAPGGQMTFQREDLKRALELDDCYWIAHEKHMRTRLDWDPSSDPPPDLFVEIEMTRSLVGRLPICAALGVPEVWRFDGESIKVFLLQDNKVYQEAKRSPTFPHVPIGKIVEFLQPGAETDYFSRIKKFRAWVRRHLPKQPKARKKPKAKE